MANAEFPKAFGKVRGAISSRKVKDYDGTVYTEKLVAYVTPSGKQKIGIRRYPVRTSAPSEKERAAQQRLAESAQYCKNLPADVREQYAREWKKAGYKYKSKKYGTLRGYIVARFYAGDIINIH